MSTLVGVGASAFRDAVQIVHARRAATDVIRGSGCPCCPLKEPPTECIQRIVGRPLNSVRLLLGSTLRANSQLQG